MVTVSIDNIEISFEGKKTILEVALQNGIYIPHLCFHPGLNSPKSLRSDGVVYRGEEEIRGVADIEYEGCHLCLVEIKGKKEFVHACSTLAEEGMVIYTNTSPIRQRRKDYLEEMLKTHPHVCMTCDLSEGCDRKICSMNVPEEARCCWKFGNCEFQSIALFVGFGESIPYSYKDTIVVDDNPLFLRDYNLCVGCLRCVVACREVAGGNAIGFVVQEGNVIVGTVAPTLKESGCRFCLACVEVCPTGALKDKKPGKNKSKIRKGIQPAVFPPTSNKDLLLLSEENLKLVPETEGVYRLWEGKENLYQITGTDNLRNSLLRELKEREGSVYLFDYEEDMMFTSRERQLIQQYLKKNGKLPPGNDEDDDLF